MVRLPRSFSRLGTVVPRRDERSGNGRTRATILLPTLNSAGHIRAVLGAYGPGGRSVTVAVDTRTTDGTLSEARRAGARVIRYTNPGSHIEAAIGPLSRRWSRAQDADGWLLRLDDDEIPSPGLLAIACDLPREYAHFAALYCSRRWVTLDREGRLLWYVHPNVANDPQLRLFRPAAVTFTDEIHTAGFDAEPLGDMPESAFILHLDWILHSRAEREAKVERYNRITPGSGTRFREFYLYEDCLGAGGSLRRLEDRKLERHVRRIAETAGAPDVWPRRRT